MKPYHETEHGVLYCGDCLDVMKQFEDDSIDLTVTSPPYDNLRDYKGYTFDFENIAKELLRVTKPGGVIVWIVGDATVNGSETGTSFRQALYFKEIGFNLHDTMIYEKDTVSFPDSHRYQSQFEYMFVLSKGKPLTFNPIKIRSQYRADNKVISDRTKSGITEKKRIVSSSSMRVKGNVWRYAVGYNKSTSDKIAFQHPAIFPEQLAADHILSWTNKGDTVLDCFFGSGTTGKCAAKYGRRYIGIELSEEYCEIAANRIDTEVDQMDIFREVCLISEPMRGNNAKP